MMEREQIDMKNTSTAKASGKHAGFYPRSMLILVQKEDFC